jgi:hypothetical protein
MRRELFEGAYRKFWDLIEAQDIPRYQCNSYDLGDLVGKAEWSVPFVGFMVSGELTESINQLNAWLRNLEDVKVWAAILAEYDEKEAWSLRNHFVEPMVHFCLLQPSSSRDRLGQVATNGIHQANLSTKHGYKDVLDQDKRKPGNFLRRNEVEMQLQRLAKEWANGDRLLTALQSLDSENYRQQTFDYRNQASHFIAPRLELGEVQIVTRNVVPADHMVQQADGSYRLEEIAGKKAVSYAFGGTRPLTLAEIIDANSREYGFAVATMQAYSDLLREALAQIPACQEREGT